MKLTLTNRDAQRMLGALKAIDEDKSIKMNSQARIYLGLNAKRLFPFVVEFESTPARRQLDFQPGDENREANVAIQRELIALPDMTFEFSLFPIKLADLSLDENATITGGLIAALSPIISDLEQPAKAA